jgi:hypothetical protein
MLTDTGCLPTIPEPRMKPGLYREFKQAANAAEKQQWFHNPPSLRTREQIILAGGYDQEVFRTVPSSKAR